MNTALRLLILCLLSGPVLADLPYMPLKMRVIPLKRVVLEGERIAFKIQIINQDKHRAYPILDPSKQDTGKKLIYFNLYSGHDVQSKLIETESREMSNRMVHSDPRYPEVKWLQVGDTFEFEVAFNGTFMKANEHHSFEYLLKAGKYKFQAIYDPQGTVSGDTLYNFMMSTHDSQHPEKLNFMSPGLVYFPVAITILKNPKTDFAIGNESIQTQQVNDSTFEYLNHLGEKISRESYPRELLPPSLLHKQQPFSIQVFSKTKTCSPSCKFCYAVRHGEDDFLEYQLRKFIRKHKYEKQAYSKLVEWLDSHSCVAFAMPFGEMLSSLPSSGSIDLGISHGSLVELRRIHVQLGKVGKIPYYSFKNKSMQRSTRVDYMKLLSVGQIKFPLPEKKQLMEQHLAQDKTTPEQSHYAPGLEYFYAIRERGAPYGSFHAAFWDLENQPDRFLKNIASIHDGVANSFRLALASGSWKKTVILDSIRKQKQIEALPYLIMLAEYHSQSNRTSLDELSEDYILALKRCVESLIGQTSYVSGNSSENTVLESIRKELPGWKSSYYFNDQILEFIRVVLIAEGKR
ncbi:MAG: hypothetical protein EP338_05170 [Bacteroidetes bacterium]|nr:MAG: hypothetical protein EP338_05170 [Bacteroidota bacterium]